MSDTETSLDHVFRALADPTRRAVIERLCAGPASVSELARPFSMALPSFMQHLRVLENAGLITTTKTGRVRTCELHPAALGAASRWLGSVDTARTRRVVNGDRGPGAA